MKTQPRLPDPCASCAASLTGCTARTATGDPCCNWCDHSLSTEEDTQ